MFRQIVTDLKSDLRTSETVLKKHACILWANSEKPHKYGDIGHPITLKKIFKKVLTLLSGRANILEHAERNDGGQITTEKTCKKVEKKC